MLQTRPSASQNCRCAWCLPYRCPHIRTITLWPRATPFHIKKHHSSVSPLFPCQVTAFRLMVVSWTMGLLSLRVAEPVSQWFQMVHDVVRDEHYLLGVQLQNHQPPTPVAPAGEAAVQAH